ncbi:MULTISPECIES: low molecular weight protein-tyrosine-phosphatase [unclassified Gemella]|uniref:low molecular weight protein-tyrosine-phosphatase n=1 Tax=unclassified Gemella TaxID=2624949 RepID=UPI0015D02C3C|nr:MULTISPECIES: low molecular weight protein-tyrosine-phosphatase [unclassified Gemella]MBF0710381.1 low molecular weight phosphotyrosine protein phosphatase [Gemella sp. GL1.1]NYS27725.1 low molecular weight phosphotyrosine protein phosphatase [Gemella sp. GL1]
MVKVIFVCLGNICRSPMAEAVFRDMVEKEGLADKIQIDSAATSTWEQGNPVHKGTVDRLAKENISTKGMFSRTLEDKDLDYDYIVGMDESNIKNIKKFVAGRESGQIKMLLEYAGDKSSIADPWYTGDFDKTYQDVLRGTRALLEVIKGDLRNG